MRITFVGNFGVDYSSENHHARSLESLGHTVIKLQEGQAHADTILLEGLQSDMLVFVHTHGWTTPGRAMSEVFGILKDKNIPTLTYHLDLWMGIERQKDLDTDPFYKTIGHFFTVDKLMADWFNENTNVKGHFIYAGVFGEECYEAPRDYQWDVAFVGSRGYHHEWPYRPQLIDWLKETYGDRFIHVGGDGQMPTTRGDALNRFYGQAKVIVGDTLCIGFDYPYYLSDRIFETTGRGGFIIHPYIKGIEDVFVASLPQSLEQDKDQEVVSYGFNDFDGLKYHIDYYIEHDDERESIRKAGHLRTKHDHTYVNRWQQIINELAVPDIMSTKDMPRG